MSSTSEQDLNLLESYLDGELPGDERDALTGRLETDSALSAALEGLRAERFIRIEAFESLEPDDRSAQQFAWQLTQSLKLGRSPVDAQARPGRRVQAGLRIVSSVAAAIIVGFGIGWATRGWEFGGGASNSLSPTQSTVVDFRVPITNDQGETIALEDFESPEQVRAYVKKSVLGIAIKPGVLTQRDKNGRVVNDQPALLISEVFPDTVAQRAGLRAGDIIVAFGGMTIRDTPSFVEAVSRQRGPTTITVVRDKKVLKLPVELNAR